MVKIKDIATAAGVSTATVSNVLNGKTNVGPDTRKKIMQLCKEMDYHPNIMARNLKMGKTNTVLFSFSDFERSFYLRVIHGINDCLLEHRMGMIICTHTSVANFLHNGLVDGAIVLDKSIKDRQIVEAAKANVRVVMMDRVIRAANVSCVVTDNDLGIQELAEGLLKRGCRRFHFVGGPVYTSDHIERYDTFRRVLEANGIPFSEDNYFQGDYSVLSGMRAGNLMVMRGDLPDAVVCANDNMAAGVLNALREHGVNVPQTVSVTGFDGDPTADVPEGYLTTAVIPRYEMGYLAAETLVKMIRQDTQPVVRRIKAPIFWGESAK